MKDDPVDNRRSIGPLQLCGETRSDRVTEPFAHKDVTTTMIGTRALNRGGCGVRSPPDPPLLHQSGHAGVMGRTRDD